MWYTKAEFRAWIGMMLVVGFIAGIAFANPFKPKIIAAPLTPHQERVYFVDSCIKRVSHNTVRPDLQAILNNCTQNALALFPIGMGNEMSLKKSTVEKALEDHERLSGE